MLRTTRGVRDLGPRQDRLGAAARAVTATAAVLGVGLERRAEDGQPVALPWGVVPRAEASAAEAHFADNPALAAYAAALRQRRGGDADPVLRGLPLLARRDGGTSRGRHAGPGGLARAVVPMDATVPADVAAAVSGERKRPQPLPQPAPLPTGGATGTPIRRAGGR